MELGQRLREERVRLGLSQADLADRVGISKKSQTNYELGHSIPPADYLAALVAAGVDVLYVLTGSASSALDAQERDLLRRFRAASAEIKAAVLAVLGQVHVAAGSAPPQQFENVGQVVSGSQEVRKQTFNVGAVPKKGGKPR